MSGILVFLLAGCAHTPTFTLPFMQWGIFLKFTIHLIGPPPTEFNIAELGMEAISAANHDGFFPPDTTRALVSQEALKAGLFNPRSPLDSSILSASPNMQWSTRPHMTNGLKNVVELTRQVDQEQHYFWSTGDFATLIWSPGSDRFGLNEIRLTGRRNAFVIDLVELDQKPVEIRTEDLLPFFNLPLPDAVSHREIKGWLNNQLFLLWVHGDPDINGLPRWGYELVVDATILEPSHNSRLLRAFVRADSDA